MLVEWINKGGAVMKLLLLLNCIGWSLMLWKSISVYLFLKRIDKQNSFFTEFLGKLKARFKTKEHIKLTDEQLFEMASSHFIAPFYKGMNTIRIIASISPLLGLLGTVLGILNSFSVIAQKGMDNPELFAQGISLALITTVGGLLVSIPHFIGYNYLSGHISKAQDKLEHSVLL